MAVLLCWGGARGWSAGPVGGRPWTNSLGMEFVWVPPGHFTMGSGTNEADFHKMETPHSEVTLSQGFWLGRYEVTQGQWVSLMTNNPSTSKSDLRQPVETVSWLEATEFCRRMAARDRAAQELPAGYAYRLPTEAQWEYACRAGSQTRFHFGDDVEFKELGDYGWYVDNAGKTTHPVGQKKPNQLGLYDMHGNVWEWCSDYWRWYSGDELLDPEFDAGGGPRVNRGGGRTSLKQLLRSAARGSGAEDYTASGLGLRVAIAPRPPQFTNDLEKVSHAIGTIFGLGLRSEGFQVDAAVISVAMRAALGDTNALKLTGPQARAILDFHKRTWVKQEGKRRRDEDLRLWEANFVSRSPKPAEIKSLPCGGQYEVLGEGSGTPPQTNDTVYVHYRIFQIDGREVRNTYTNAQPDRVMLDQQLLDLELREALLLMRPGAKWRILLASNFGDRRLAVGAAPRNGLVYEVELVSKRPTREVLAETQGAGETKARQEKPPQ